MIFDNFLVGIFNQPKKAMSLKKVEYKTSLKYAAKTVKKNLAEIELHENYGSGNLEVQ